MIARTPLPATIKLIASACLFLCVNGVVASTDKTAATAEGPVHQTGKVTYYADKFHGRLTANGERFSNQELTMAHRTLPMGTKVLVTNLQNQRSVVVRVNDRGPYARNYIADLSHAAATQLNMIRAGVVSARLQIVHAGTEIGKAAAAALSPRKQATARNEPRRADRAEQQTQPAEPVRLADNVPAAPVTLESSMSVPTER